MNPRKDPTRVALALLTEPSWSTWTWLLQPHSAAGAGWELVQRKNLCNIDSVSIRLLALLALLFKSGSTLHASVYTVMFNLKYLNNYYRIKRLKLFMQVHLSILTAWQKKKKKKSIYAADSLKFFGVCSQDQSSPFSEKQGKNPVIYKSDFSVGNRNAKQCFVFWKERILS